jgi:NADPH2:quinone reductase
VKASSVNGFDVYVASGMAKGMMEHRYPVVMGKDYAGVLDAVGEGVVRFAVGEEVAGIASPEQHLGRGACAEFIVVPAEGYIEPKPSTLSFEQAASVGLAALTAHVAVEAVDASAGRVVLVTGVTGGVGSYAVEIAAPRGATVIATSLLTTIPGRGRSVRARSSTTAATSRKRSANPTQTRWTQSSTP